MNIAQFVQSKVQNQFVRHVNGEILVRRNNFTVAIDADDLYCCSGRRKNCEQIGGKFVEGVFKAKVSSKSSSLFGSRTLKLFVTLLDLGAYISNANIGHFVHMNGQVFTILESL